MAKLSCGLRNVLRYRTVLVLILVCSLLNVYHSAEVKADTVENHSGYAIIEDWQLISSSATTSSGPGVNTYMKSYPGTQLSAFRGVGTLDIHISVAMGLFCDFNLAYEWVAMLESIQSHPIYSDTAEIYSTEILEMYGDCRPNGATDIVHQTLKIPWPISPREIVLERNFTYVEPKWLQEKSRKDVTNVVEVAEVGVDGDVTGESAKVEVSSEGSEGDSEEGGTIVIRYHSVEDDRIPMHPGRVRAESPLTMWRFQDVTERERALRGSDQDMTKRYTEIEVQVLVDSKGYIPVWFINSIQRLWPARAMGAFNKLIKKKDVKKEEKNKNRVCNSRNSTTACSDGVKPFMPVAHW